MIRVSLIGQGIVRNAIFDLSSPGNRDNCYYPYWLLRERFKVRGVDLNTGDVNQGQEVAFELHMNAQRRSSPVPRYVLLWEVPQIWPDNALPTLLRKYRRIFTWDDQLADGRLYIKINFPNEPQIFQGKGWSVRDRFCCIIAGNKSVVQRDPRELYSQRVETIRWFERHAPQQFDLYGVGWEAPPPKAGRIGKLWSRIATHPYRLMGVRPFPSYRGTVNSKRETLTRYRFSICYENMRDVPGYITEKIFDCLFAGCVPVYWGAPNIADYIPPECFIDRRQFSDHESLYRFLMSISEDEYVSYQIAIKAFLESQAALPFYADAFVSTLIDTVLSDLGRAS